MWIRSSAADTAVKVGWRDTEVMITEEAICFRKAVLVMPVRSSLRWRKMMWISSGAA